MRYGRGKRIATDTFVREESRITIFSQSELHELFQSAGFAVLTLDDKVARKKLWQRASPKASHIHGDDEDLTSFAIASPHIKLTAARERPRSATLRSKSTLGSRSRKSVYDYALRLAHPD